MKLAAHIARATQRAVASGALVSIPTDALVIEDGGISFIVRVLTTLAQKDAVRAAAAAGRTPRGARSNPFLPYEAAMHVMALPPAHVCLLNKYNVIDGHILIVTRDYAEQEELLTRADLAATWRCLDEVDGLAFYNGGEAAGASQKHKHLQWVPLPLADRGPPVPIEPLIESACLTDGIGRVARLPFTHGLIRLDASRDDAVDQIFAGYRRLAGELGLGEPPGRQRRPYNLLLTRRWMLAVPRSTECFDQISINAIGFAGALLVRSAEQVEKLRQRGPLTALASVGVQGR